MRLASLRIYFFQLTHTDDELLVGFTPPPEMWRNLLPSGNKYFVLVLYVWPKGQNMKLKAWAKATECVGSAPLPRYRIRRPPRTPVWAVFVQHAQQLTELQTSLLQYFPGEAELSVVSE